MYGILVRAHLKSSLLNPPQPGPNQASANINTSYAQPQNAPASLPESLRDSSRLIRKLRAFAR